MSTLGNTIGFTTTLGSAFAFALCANFTATRCKNVDVEDGVEKGDDEGGVEGGS